MPDVQLKVRIPIELHAKIVAAADANKRSATAEVASRLEASFSNPSDSALIESLYILLDANGYPLSWAEIHEFIAALWSGNAQRVGEMHVEVITPDMESSSRRKAQAVALAKKLRPGEKSLVLKPLGRAPR